MADESESESQSESASVPDSGDGASDPEASPSADLEGFAEAETEPEPEPQAVVGLPKDHPGVVPPPDDDPEPTEDIPSGGLLRIRGEVDQTKAIALFLGGLTTLLAVWFFLTAGDARSVRWTTTIAETGTVELTELPDGEVWVDGYSLFEGEGELTDRDFKVDGKTITFLGSLAGEEVDVGYLMGSEPIVSHFILPQPPKVLSAIMGNVTGPSYEVACPGAACPTKELKTKLNLSGGDGEALQRYRGGLDPDPPGINCPQCNVNLDNEVAIALPAYRFRWGLLSTVRRTLTGFGIAVLICMPLGVLAGAFPPVKRFVSPLEIAGGYTPPVALLPLAVALYGVAKNSGMDSVMAAEVARTTFLVTVIAFWLYPLITSEVESVDEVYINTAYTLGATRTQTILKVLVPVSMANIWQHLRATYAIGWASIILAEGFAVGREAGETGIGFFMVDMQRRNVMEQYFAAVLAIVVTGIVLDFLFKRAGKLLFPYQEAN